MGNKSNNKNKSQANKQCDARTNKRNNSNGYRNYKNPKFGNRSQSGNDVRDDNSATGSIPSDSKAKFYVTPVKSTRNDPSWYYKSEDALRDVASFSYNLPIGANLNEASELTMASNVMMSAAATAVPGVMGLMLALTPGVAADATSPINIAANNVYTFVRYKNSGASNYDAPDLMLYLFAMDNIYAAWNWAKRIYGYASVYSQVNRYKPQAYAAIDNVDLDDIYNNMADFRAQLNLLADRISAFCVPAVFTLMIRHSWVFANLFKDAESTRAQEYMYSPMWFYQYDETSSPQGGVLSPVLINDTISKGKWTASGIISMLRGMLNALEYSEDIGIMSGDILKAYGDGELFHISHIDADYKLEALYDKGILSQIENTQIIDQALWKDNINAWFVRQDPNTNYIKFQPTFTGSGAVVGRVGAHLNFHWDNPTPNDVIEASRLIPAISYSTDRKTLTLISAGSEVCCQIRIAAYMQSTNAGSPATLNGTQTLEVFDLGAISCQLNGNVGPDFSSLVKMAMVLWHWEAFDWAPAVELSTSYNDGSGTYYYKFPLLRDWDVFTKLNTDDIQALNLLAIQSEFNLPN